MADLGMSFDANEVNPNSGFDALPEGDYQLHIVEADVKQNSKGSGNLLSFKAEVIEPAEYQGRFVFERLNITHSNPVAQKIGQEALSALCHACGVKQVRDTDQLLFQPFAAELKIEPYTDKNGNAKERNAIKRYHFEGSDAPPASKPEPAAAPSAAPSRPAQKPAAPAVGAKKFPWQNK